MKFADWNAWSPDEYLREYYLAIEPDERFLLEFLVEQVRHLAPTPIALDYGCGPTVHRLFPLVPKVATFHLAEYLPANRATVEAWRRGEENVFDWSAFSAQTLRLEGAPDAPRAREDATRARIAEILATDARQADPLGPERRGFYPLVTTHYCADSATDDPATWRLFMENITSLVAPGGTLIASSLGGSAGYRVGTHWFPGAAVRPADLLTLLEDAGFEEIDLRVRAVTDRTDQGYDSVFFVRAVRSA